jgi:acetyl esterase/lipase
VRKRGPEIIQLEEQYGEHPLQAGEWYAPLGDEVAPTVVLIHGGFWRPEYERYLEHSVATDLARRGYLCWNIDYRSAAEPWPATLTDVAAAYDHVLRGALAGRVDTARVAVVGHSAGGHLAAWLASRHNLPAGAPGHNPDALRPALAVPQAGVVALSVAADRQVGRGAVAAFVGGKTAAHPERYLVADPIKLLPTGVRSVLIHPLRDKSVPIQQSRLYVEAALEAGDDSRLEASRGDHFAHIDPKTHAHGLLLDALATMTGPL